VPHRFYIPGLDPAAGVVPLPPDEAAHLQRVLRLRPGAIVQVFDGGGQEWRAEVTSVTRRDATVHLLDRLEPVSEPAVAVTMVTAILKGEKMDAVIRDTVMLGAAAIRPLVTARTEVTPASLARRSRLERWHRIAVASAKQSGRATVPPILPWQTFDAYLSSDPDVDVRLMLVEPGAGVTARPLAAVAPPRRAAVLVGPEGGWTDSEIARALEAQVEPVRLGARTLRADSVPLVALAMCYALWEDRREESSR
jgi:16S rRNA (uracil1498-N3)-methyltransferase